MAAGAPIVASDIHGYKGVVRRGEQGLLVPPGEPRELAGAISRLVLDDRLRAEMSLSGMVRAEGFSWERVTDRVEAYYGFVIRRLAAQGALPADFRADVPPSPRTVATGSDAGGSGDDPPSSAVPDEETPAALVRGA